MCQKKIILTTVLCKNAVTVLSKSTISVMTRTRPTLAVVSKKCQVKHVVLVSVFMT